MKLVGILFGVKIYAAEHMPKDGMYMVVDNCKYEMLTKMCGNCFLMRNITPPQTEAIEENRNI